MFPAPPPPTPPRESILSVALGLVALGGFLVFMILVSGGFFLYVLFGGFAILGVGMMHYWLWGQRLDRQTEGEVEEERLRQEMDGTRAASGGGGTTEREDERFR